MTNEIDVIKGVVENMQYEVDTVTSATKDKTEDTKKTVNELLDTFKNRIKNTENETVNNHKKYITTHKMVLDLQGKTEKQINEMKFKHTFFNKSI